MTCLDERTEALIAEALTPDEFGRVHALVVYASRPGCPEFTPSRNHTDAEGIRSYVKYMETAGYQVRVSHDICG